MASYLQGKLATSGEWSKGPVCVVAIGKAAAQMAAGAFDVLGPQLLSALIVTKRGHCEPLFSQEMPVRCFEAAHPVPDETSIQAGHILLAYLDRAPASAKFLLLISGGASSLVELLPLGVTTNDLVRTHQWLLAAGLPITAINRVRKRISCLKAGRLAVFLRGRETLSLLISDVPGDDPRVIGSGLLTSHNAGDIAVSDLPLPSWLLELTADPPPLPHPQAFSSIHTEVVAWPALARKAAAEVATARGYQVHVHNNLLAGDATQAGRNVIHQVFAGLPGIHIWSGEATVQLPPQPGQGGRCQSLALAAAMCIVGRDDTWLLAAGTDGTDGHGTVAGATVDGGTIDRGTRFGLNPERCLAGADAGTFLRASNDLIITGPTGTNVMDLVVALRCL